MKVPRLLLTTLVAAGLLLVAAPQAAQAAPATSTLARSAPPVAAKPYVGALPKAGFTPQTLFGPYRFKSLSSGRCLDADRNTIPANGTRVQLWDCLGANQTNQGWYFESTSLTGVYRIRSQFNAGKCLDADLNTISGNGTKVQLWDCLVTMPANQIWALTATKFANIYRLTSTYNGRCLDADLNTIGGNGTKVQLWDCLGDTQYNQDWLFA